MAPSEQSGAHRRQLRKTRINPALFQAPAPQTEAYHRNYVALHPNEPYIVYNDLPKLVALKKAYPQLLAQK